MSGNSNFFWGLIVFFFFIWTLKTCTNFNSNSLAKVNLPPQYNTTISVVGEQAASGLDLSRLGEIIKVTKTAEELEKKLNSQNGINNLDLNDDKQVDYIKVTEYKINATKWGFSLSTEVDQNEEQEIATIEIEKDAENVNVNVSGNRQIYGTGTHYNSFYSGSSFFFLGYLLASRSPYVSPFGWGYYPSYYSYYSPVSRNNYRQNISRYRSGNKVANYQSSSLNPNKQKVASKGIKKSLRNPTATQRSFQRNIASSAKPGKGGFGRMANSSSYRSVRGSTFGRSSGGFGK